MKLTDCKLIPSTSDPLTGTVSLGTRSASYEVLGPFGQGYNIKVELDSEEGTLNYHWTESPWAQATTSVSTYEISVDTICEEQKEILHLSKKGHFEPISDEVALALFIVRHHFGRKTGPFKKRT